MGKLGIFKICQELNLAQMEIQLHLLNALLPLSTRGPGEARPTIQELTPSRLNVFEAEERLWQAGERK